MARRELEGGRASCEVSRRRALAPRNADVCYGVSATAPRACQHTTGVAGHLSTSSFTKGETEARVTVTVAGQKRGRKISWRRPES